MACFVCVDSSGCCRPPVVGIAAVGVGFGVIVVAGGRAGIVEFAVIVAVAVVVVAVVAAVVAIVATAAVVAMALPREGTGGGAPGCCTTSTLDIS